MIFQDRLTKEQSDILNEHLSNVPVKLGELAKELGLIVKVSTLRYGKSGQIKPSQSAPSGFEIKVNRHESKERQRFTLAHEIAHFLLHKDKIQNGVEETVLYRAEGISNQEEIEANKLAAELMMPSRMIKIKLDGRIPNEDIAEELAREFRASIPAMSIRLGV